MRSMPSRRSFLLQSAGAFAASAAARKPNILFLFTDDQRADTIAALGNSRIRTPNLDSLARRGWAMRNAYCMGGNSPAVCTPSRNMLLSGRAYTRYPMYAEADRPNFPDALRAAGYQTYHHGKRGNSALRIQERFEINKYLENEQASRRAGSPGERIASDAAEFIRTRSKDRPFFAYLAFEAPHDPRVPAERHRPLYQPDRMRLPENFLPVHPFDNGEMTVRDELLAPWPRTPEEIRRQTAEYYAVITGLDENIGRVLAALREAGEEQNTIVIFSSDQGIALGSHGLMGKQNLYDPSMKAPLLFAGPGIPHGESSALVYLLDIFPTVLDLVGAPQPQGIDGRSFRAAFGSPAAGGRESLYLGYRQCQRAVRDERYKLILYPQINRVQLFDLRDDPFEKRDLSARPEQRERVARMRKQIEAWQAKLGDTLPLESSAPKPAAFTPPTGEALAELRRRWKME